MKKKELVGKRVLVRLNALPREEQEQRLSEPVFDRFSIVEVVGYSLTTGRVIIDAKSLSWSAPLLEDTDVIAKKAKTYWSVNLNDIDNVLPINNDVINN